MRFCISVVEERTCLFNSFSSEELGSAVLRLIFFLSFHLCSILVPPLFPSRPGQTQSKLICFHVHTRAADNDAHCKPLFCRQIHVLLLLYTGAFASRLIIAWSLTMSFDLLSIITPSSTVAHWWLVSLVLSLFRLYHHDRSFQIKVCIMLNDGQKLAPSTHSSMHACFLVG
jgi:hypothetical protein